MLRHAVHVYMSVLHHQGGISLTSGTIHNQSNEDLYTQSRRLWLKSKSPDRGEQGSPDPQQNTNTCFYCIFAPLFTLSVKNVLHNVPVLVYLFIMTLTFDLHVTLYM